MRLFDSASASAPEMVAALRVAAGFRFGFGTQRSLYDSVDCWMLDDTRNMRLFRASKRRAEVIERDAAY